MYGMERLITKEVFCELSSRRGLEVLGIGGVVTEDFVVSARAHTNGFQDLFPALVGLTCAASAAGMLLLSEDLRNLERAEITLVEPAANFLENFSQACPELEHLCVMYTTPSHIEIPPGELLAVPRNLQRLTHLNVTGKITSPSLQDEHIATFAQEFSEMVTVLRLCFRETGLTEKSLVYLGQCLGSVLVECELVGKFEIAGLGDVVLFPVLKELALREAVDWKERGQELVKGWAPEVEDVQFWTGFGGFE